MVPHGFLWLSSCLEKKQVGYGVCGCMGVYWVRAKENVDEMQGSETHVFHADQRLH